MSNTVSAGDWVTIVERESVAADIKSGLYFPHFAGLTGEIGKVYDDGSLTVVVSLNSLPDDVRKRHQTGSDALRQDWLDKLSNESRNKLSSAEKKFALTYTILTGHSDVVKIEKPASEIASPARKTLEEIEADEQEHLQQRTK